MHELAWTFLRRRAENDFASNPFGEGASAMRGVIGMMAETQSPMWREAGQRMRAWCPKARIDRQGRLAGLRGEGAALQLRQWTGRRLAHRP